MSRQQSAALRCCLLLCGALVSGTAQAWPDRPLRFIVGFGAGGTSDIIARRFAQDLSMQLGQPIPVENRTGAGGNVAFEAAAHAEPDGNTMVLGSPAFTVNPALYGDRIRWRQEDLAPVILIGFTPIAVIVRAEHPAQTLRALVEAPRQGPLLAGISGSGTSSHLANILLRQATRMAMENVSYTGGAAPFLDLMAGRLELMTFPAPETVSYLEAGRIRILALTERTGATAFRGIPTVAEAGYPEAAMATWYGLMVPRRTPPEITVALHRAAAAVLADPAARARLAELSVDPAGGSPGEFADFIRRETTRWQRVIAETNTRVE
jgi:tripartite-type tricarboxylate transporter receptor subunit TctC